MAKPLIWQATYGLAAPQSTPATSVRSSPVPSRSPTPPSKRATKAPPPPKGPKESSKGGRLKRKAPVIEEDDEEDAAAAVSDGEEEVDAVESDVEGEGEVAGDKVANSKMLVVLLALEVVPNVSQCTGSPG